MIVIGLTGGIGSGKSTVASYFAELGIPVLDADQIARDLIKAKTLAFNKIVDYFGKDILNSDGKLNRRLLRKLIFENPNDKKWLEKLLHPLIKRTIKKRLRQLSSPYAILEAPLLLESKFTDVVDRILVIDTSEALQIKRIQSRDDSGAEQVRAIIDSQVSREERLAKADDIIHNDGNLDALQKQINLLHKQYLKLSKK